MGSPFPPRVRYGAGAGPCLYDWEISNEVKDFSAAYMSIYILSSSASAA